MALITILSIAAMLCFFLSVIFFYDDKNANGIMLFLIGVAFIVLSNSYTSDYCKFCGFEETCELCVLEKQCDCDNHNSCDCNEEETKIYCKECNKIITITNENVVASICPECKAKIADNAENDKVNVHIENNINTDKNTEIDIQTENIPKENIEINAPTIKKNFSYCFECGEKLNESNIYHFCPYCGTDINN